MSALCRGKYLASPAWAAWTHVADRAGVVEAGDADDDVGSADLRRSSGARPRGRSSRSDMAHPRGGEGVPAGRRSLPRPRAGGSGAWPRPCSARIRFTASAHPAGPGLSVTRAAGSFRRSCAVAPAPGFRTMTGMSTARSNGTSFGLSPRPTVSSLAIDAAVEIRSRSDRTPPCPRRWSRDRSGRPRRIGGPRGAGRDSSRSRDGGSPSTTRNGSSYSRAWPGARRRAARARRPPPPAAPTCR